MFGSMASEWRRPVAMLNVGMWLRSRSMAAFGFSRSSGWRRDGVMPQRPRSYTKILATLCTDMSLRPRTTLPASAGGVGWMSHRVRPELAIGPARGRTRWAGPMVNSAKSTVGSPPEGPDGFRVMLTPSYGPCGGGWGRRRKRLILLALYRYGMAQVRRGCAPGQPALAPPSKATLWAGACL